MATVATRVATVTAPQDRERSTFAFRIMLVFSFLYYFHPSDVIPGLSHIPVAKITGAVALLALIFGTRGQASKKLPTETKLVIAMFVWMVICIPFAYWRMGSVTVVLFEFSKALIVCLTLTLAVRRFSELRTLILIQAMGVALMTFASLVVNNRQNGRLAGIGDNLLSNPNDLAINIALNLPFCLALFLSSKAGIKKAFWGLSMIAMMYAVMATYSRSGFLALSVGAVICLWEFGIRGKRFYILIAAFLGLLAFVAVSPKDYSKRLASIVGIRQRGDKDKGSAEAREDLLIDSLTVTAQRPLFGVGPGNFQAYTKTWRVTHNTYTELSAECGIPGLLMFLALLVLSFRNVNRVRKSKLFDKSSEVKLLSSALWAGLAAYLVGAFFASTGYELFPYYMVTYTMLLYRFAQETDPKRLPVERPAVGRGYTPGWQREGKSFPSFRQGLGAKLPQ